MELTMASMANLPGLTDLCIEARNERPMAVAFAAIVLSWSVACALTLL
jgi:hypothetical protein